MCAILNLFHNKTDLTGHCLIEQFVKTHNNPACFNKNICNLKVYSFDNLLIKGVWCVSYGRYAVQFTGYSVCFQFQSQGCGKKKIAVPCLLCHPLSSFPAFCG